MTKVDLLTPKGRRHDTAHAGKAEVALRPQPRKAENADVRRQRAGEERTQARRRRSAPVRSQTKPAKSTQLIITNKGTQGGRAFKSESSSKLESYKKVGSNRGNDFIANIVTA